MSRRLRTHHASQLLSSGPTAVRFLLSQLNAAGDNEDVVRVRDMVRDMNEIDRIVRSKGFPVLNGAKLSFDLEAEWNSLGLDEAVQERMKRVRETYERFNLRLRPVCPLKHGWKFHMMNPWSGDPKKRALILWTFLSIIHDLAVDGQLRRVRECDCCHRWFFAYRTHSRFRFCKRACRVKHWRASPEGKAKRRAFMRKYRGGLKRRQQENLRVARERRKKRK
jgi:hypothetical protein